jgi:tetratricopeptide (TPR) repeat protein
MPAIIRNKVFVSYSHKDKKLFEEFKTMLAPAIRDGVVDVWDDTRIVPGAKWKDEILKALGSAKVAVLLVSQYFLASDFIARHELPPLLKAAQDQGVTVFWIYLSSCLYEQTEIATYQAAHDVSKPLDRLDKPHRQAILSEVCAKLVHVAQPSPAISSQTGRQPPVSLSDSAPSSTTPAPRKNSKPAPKGAARGRTPTAVDSYQRGLRHLADGNYDEALDAFNQTIEFDPTLALAFYNRGLTHYNRRDDDLAIDDFDRALELGFNDAIVFRNRANAFSRKGDVARALADYAQAITLEPENPLAYLNRGEVHENTLRKDLAIADYKTILSLVCEPQYQDIARQRLLALGVKVSEPSSSPALAIWQKKLEFLQAEEAKAADADQKFSIQQRIEEAKAKIQELGG